MFRLTCGQVNQIGSITDAIEAGNGLREELMCTELMSHPAAPSFQKVCCSGQSHFATLGCNHVSKCWMGRHGVPWFR